MSVEIHLEPTDCPFCRDNTYSFFLSGKDQFYDVPGEYQLVRCRGCRHVYMNPRPTAESLAACYPAGYSPHQPAENQPAESGDHADSAPKPAQRTPWYLSRWARAIPGLRSLYYWLTDTNSVFIPDLPSENARAVELGCAAGRFLEVLRSRGWAAQGVELVPEPAAEARKHGFEVHVGTFEEAHLADATFDAAFAFKVIEHLADPLHTLQEFRRVLKPGGWFVFSIPNAGSWEARLFGRYWSDYELPRHLQHFTVDSIHQFLKKAGFTEVRVMHQRTVLGLIGSLGVVFSEWLPRSRIGPTLKRWYRENPPMWVYLMTAAVIKPIIAIFGSGRLTIVARKPER
jgi:SAM-dependent methyltransferase